MTDDKIVELLTEMDGKMPGMVRRLEELVCEPIDSPRRGDMFAGIYGDLLSFMQGGNFEEIKELGDLDARLYEIAQYLHRRRVSH